MKPAFIPQVRVEPELRAKLDAALRPGETLTDFVESSLRSAIEYRHVQNDFDLRCEESLAEYRRTGVSHPADEVFDRLEARVAAKVAEKVKQLQAKQVRDE